jgi:acid phosphatase type 7
MSFRRAAAPTSVLVILIACGDPSGSGPGTNQAPVPVFTSSCTALTCSFTDASSDPDGTITERVWDFGDDAPPTASTSHSYDAAGTYHVSLTVTDNGGATASVTHDVIVQPAAPGNQSPHAAFVSTCAALTCSFTDQSSDPDGTISSRTWEFGDGAKSSETNPSHTYSSAGTFSVVLTVTDNGGATASTSAQIQTQGGSGDAVFIGAGDIAGCASDYKDKVTAAILGRFPTATIYTLGDNAYNDGTPADYANCYAPGWGKFKDRTRPAPGNHDYHTAGAPGYFGYFGDRAGPAGRGYYSFDLGGWHIISLNSEIDASATSAQATWLKQDLADHTSTCTLAYWHKPLFTSALVHPPDPRFRDLFAILNDAGAEIVLSGHNHHYERFGPMRPDGTADPNGIREFVVGSGGSASLYDFGPAQPNSEVRFKGWGVLKLTLGPASYGWEFLGIEGSTFTDRGQGSCH